MTVADTVTQVCVVGLSLMGINTRQLRSRPGLRDLVNIQLPTLGAASCRLTKQGHSNMQDAFFVKSVRQLQTSLAAWKDLGLVHATFPLPPPHIAAVE